MTYDKASLRDNRALMTVEPVEYGHGTVRNAAGRGAEYSHASTPT